MPSQSGSLLLSRDEQRYYAAMVAKGLSLIGGGATVVLGKGYWISSSSGELVEEEVAIVTTYCSHIGVDVKVYILRDCWVVFLFFLSLSFTDESEKNSTVAGRQVCVSIPHNESSLISPPPLNCTIACGRSVCWWGWMEKLSWYLLLQNEVEDK